MEQSFIVSATPHVRSNETVQSIMRDVIIALIPATVMGVLFFGLNALLLIVISIASCVFFEFVFQKITKRTITIDDLSAAVTGLLLALNLPPTAPWWMPIVGSLFAIIIAKQFFGGIGQNFVNPALFGRAALMASYPTAMTTWSEVTLTVDGITNATPLALLKSGEITSVSSNQIMNAFLGNHIGGCIGEISALAILIGGIYLIAKKIISWRIPVVYILTVFILTAIIGRNGVRLPHYEILVGGLFLGAFFMATDYTTSPMTAKGQIIMAIGCGLITTLIRIFGGYPEGVSYSILIMNLCVPLIDRFVKDKIFGAKPKEAKK